MSPATAPARQDGRLFCPTGQTGVFLFDAELPARYPLMISNVEREGHAFVCLLFSTDLNADERAQEVRRAAAGPSAPLTPELAEAVAHEIVRADLLS